MPDLASKTTDLATLSEKVDRALDMLSRLLASQPSTGATEGGAVTVATAAELTGLGKTKLFELIGNGTIKSSRIGRRRLIPRSELNRLLVETQTPATV